MAILTRLVTLVLMLWLLTSCGEGYAIEPARLNLIHADKHGPDELQKVVTGFLAQEGFEDLGRQDEMIALLKRSGGPEAATDSMIERLSRERSFVNRDRDLSVEILDYADGAASGPHLGYAPKARNFIEIRISEGRPGGASREGHAFYGRFLAALKARFGEDVVEVNGLPATDEAEYRRVTTANRIGAVISWCIAFALGFAVTSPLALLLLRRTKLAVLPRRLIFTGATVWLATPVLMPAGFIFVIAAPNALAFPWTYTELYSKGAPYNQVSFLCSFVLCAAASILLVKGRREDAAPSVKEPD